MDGTQLPRHNLKDITLGERIGKGNFPVYKATMAGKAIAVKKMDCDKNEIPREVEVHSILPPHPNVLSLLGVAHNKSGFSIYICMELADTSLYHYLHVEKRKPSLQQSTKWALQIASGMHHIHQHGLAHRDLKSANILLFEEEEISKVCDFGSARILERTATMTGMTGTYRWMAPEFNDTASTKVNQRCDVFSYGMVLHEIFTHRIPFSDIEEDKDVLPIIREGKRPSVPQELPLYIKVLMQSCWKHKSHERPSFERIFQVLGNPPAHEEEIQDMLDEKTPLHKAAESGDADAVQRLIGTVNINAQTVDGKTALHFASEGGHVSVIQILSDAITNINLQDKDGNTALFLAASGGHVAVVHLLLQHLADVHICNKDDLSPLFAASKEGYTEIVDILLQKGVDPNLFNTSSHLTPLGAAAHKGHAETVEKLLKGGAKINQQDKLGQTPLYCASREGHMEVVEVLLQKHADVHICEMQSCCTPLGIAALKGHTKIVEKLLKEGANINYQDKHGYTALYYASRVGHVDVVQLLLQQLADFSICNENGMSPLFVASLYGYTNIVDILLKSGANPSLATTTGPLSVPLGVAAEEGHTQTLDRLLKGGSNINHQDKYGHTALHLASQKGHVEAVRMLLQQHADVSIRDVNGGTAETIARCKGHTDVTTLFQKNWNSQ